MTSRTHRTLAFLLTLDLSGVLLTSGCGTVSPGFADGGADGATADGGAGDAAVPDDGAAADAGQDDAGGPLPVSIRVNAQNGSGSPDPGAIAVFTDADGTVVFDGLVDANGEATAVLEPGGEVTVIRLSAGGTNRNAFLMTITDVQPGDELLFGPLPYAGTGPQVGTMATTYTPYPNASPHVFYTACDAQTAPATTAAGPALSFYEDCQPAELDLLLVATLPTSVPRFVAMHDVDLQLGATIAVPNSYSVMNSFTVNFTNVPAEVTRISANRATILGRQNTYTSSANIPEAGAGVVSLAMSYPPGIGDQAQILANVYRSGTVGFQVLEQQTNQIAASAGFDLSAGALPWFTSEPFFDGSAVAWTETGTGTTDIRFVELGGSWPEDGNTRSVYWMIATPPGGSAVTLPYLPAGYANIHPAAQATINNAYASVMYQDYDVYDGYAEAHLIAQTLAGYEQIRDTGAFPGQNVTRRASLSFEF
jgi:hypothetical protein